MAPKVTSPSVVAILQRALVSGSKWPDKDDFLDVVYWFRQILALIFGFAWGVLGVKGIIGIGLFCAINAILIYVYTNSYQRVDEDDYGGTWEIAKEGFMTSFATFLIMWIICYTGVYHSNDS